MLKYLRTKGMTLRHWRMIGQKLNFTVDPSTLTLMKLINLKLHEGDQKMSIIKAVSEIATKEFAANNGLDQLDREVKAQEFQLHPYKETGVNIVLKLAE